MAKSTGCGFVYIFASSQGGPCKIGFSTNPDKRLRSFRESGHFQLNEEARWPSNEARLLEKSSHKSLAGYRIAGEWFRIDVTTARAVVNEIFTRLPELVAARRQLETNRLSNVEVAALGNAASVASRQRRILEELSLIKDEWLAGKVPTRELMSRVSVDYATARKVFGPRRPYRKRGQLPLLSAPAISRKGFSAEKQRAETACKVIADRWPCSDHRTEDLLREAGVSRNTAILYLGKRPRGKSGPRAARRSTWIGPAFGMDGRQPCRTKRKGHQMPDSLTQCSRNGAALCPTCGATAGEACPYADLTPGLIESTPITAGAAGGCNADDGVCDSCQ